MRKTIIGPIGSPAAPQAEQEWFDLEQMARVEATSEDPSFPIESALVSGKRPGWRAAKQGAQTIRIIFDRPAQIRRIKLEFSETEIARTQEFTLLWSTAPNQPLKEIVRQQWTFSPKGSTVEIEDYQVQLDGVRVLQLDLKPDVTASNAYAMLARWRIM